MFSVIIPLYNRANTIERAIRSVLTQQEQQFEIIVVNDGSTDPGADYARSFTDPRIRVIDQSNGGVSKARNTGIALAQYDYVTFLDADDEYLPTFLKTLKILIKKYPTVATWAVGYQYQNPDGTITSPNISGVDADFEGILKDYFLISARSSSLIWTGAVCVRKQVLQQIQGFPEGITSGEDLLTWSRMVLRGGLCLSRKCCSTYYIEPFCDYSVKPPPADAGFVIDQVGRALISELEHWEYAENKKQFQLYISYWFKMRAACNLRRRKNKVAFWTALQSLKYDWLNHKSWIILLLSMFPKKISYFLINRFRQG